MIWAGFSFSSIRFPPGKSFATILKKRFPAYLCARLRILRPRSLVYLSNAFAGWTTSTTARSAKCSGKKFRCPLDVYRLIPQHITELACKVFILTIHNSNFTTFTTIITWWFFQTRHIQLYYQYHACTCHKEQLRVKLCWDGERSFCNEDNVTHI